MPLGEWPTPVEPLDLADGVELWVKREDRCAWPYGGNKVRKLEWLLPVLSEHRDAVVTFGAVGSNHVLATVTYARRFGLKVHAVLVPQPATTAVERNAAVTAALAHRVWTASGEVGAVGAYIRANVAAMREDGRRPGLLWVGGSSPRGVLGWVDGGLEIARQVVDGVLPRVRHIVVPAGTGGIAAGLMVGTAIAGLDVTVHAVRVAEPLWSNRPMVTALARSTARLLRAHGDVPDLHMSRLRLHRRWLGTGYGHPTPAAGWAAEFAARHGLHVEPTYTSKTLAAATAIATAAHPEPVLWVATANSWPLEEVAGGEVPSIPSALEALLR